jgi:hypothetical protein
MFNLLGETWVENMLGVSSEENANKNDLKVIKDKNRTIKNDIKNYKSGVNRILNAGFELGEVPLYFAYNVAANYRNNLKSKDINPQTAKVHRELATIPASNVDFSNPAHMNFLNSALAVSEDFLSMEMPLSFKITIDPKPPGPGFPEHAPSE